MQWTIYHRLHGTLITQKPVSVSGHQKVLKSCCWKLMPESMPGCSRYQWKILHGLHHPILYIHKMLAPAAAPAVIKKNSWDVHCASPAVAELAGHPVHLGRPIMNQLLHCMVLFCSFFLALQRCTKCRNYWWNSYDVVKVREPLLYLSDVGQKGQTTHAQDSTILQT